MRHRRPAQRRQVDALQRAHAARASRRRTIRSARSSPTSASSRCPIRGSRALAAIAKPEKVIPAIVEFVDIAGLVAGASKGEGLGNQFLANIRETDAIAHVVRCFEDDNVVHVAGKIDPGLRHRDDQHRARARRPRRRSRSSSRRYEKAARAGGDKEAQRHRRGAREGAGGAGRGPARAHRRPLRRGAATLLQPFFLLTMKPTMYVANVAEHGFHGQSAARRGRGARGEGRRAGRRRSARRSKRRSPISTATTSRRSSPTSGMTEPGLDRVIHAGYKLLGLQTYFTAGPKEVRAWTIHARRHGAAGRRRDPHRLREGLHPRRGDRLRRLHRAQGRAGREGSGQDAARGQGVRRARTATSCTSASTSSGLAERSAPRMRSEHANVLRLPSGGASRSRSPAR